MGYLQRQLTRLCLVFDHKAGVPHWRVAIRTPFDQQLYGTIQRYQKTGWSNFNGLQFEFEHRYSKGYAFQVFYVMSNALEWPATDGAMTSSARPTTTCRVQFRKMTQRATACCSTAGTPEFRSIA